jgi:dTDP-4-dehydrorhamnose reductase
LSEKIKILITGANGQLGMEFRTLAEVNEFADFTFVAREELAIDNPTDLEDFFSRYTFQYCINCAAYTAVDKAESEKEMAIAINATAVENLARLCSQHQTRFIHFSTDYVFDGNGNHPYTEEEQSNPVNFYGQTKLSGEDAALAENKDCIIIRTSWVYSRFGKNFVKTMVRLMAEREEIAVVQDQLGSPTYAADLAEAVISIIQSNTWLPGIYHYCNKGIISWFEFATAIKELTGSQCKVNAINTTDFPTPAKRPAYSALCTQKIENIFGLSIPAWRNSLQKCLNTAG